VPGGCARAVKGAGPRRAKQLVSSARRKWTRACTLILPIWTPSSRARDRGRGPDEVGEGKSGHGPRSASGVDAGRLAAWKVVTLTRRVVGL
jgi:hypothetical protein